MDDPVLRGTLDVVESPERATKARFYSTVAKWNHEKLANYGCGALVLYCAAVAVLSAESKPFWTDEIVTLAIVRLPTISGMWDALRRVVDAFPPPFFLLERCADKLPLDPHIAVRLPSILGFCCILLSVFAFIRRRSGGIIALVCAASLLLTVLFEPYSVEARAYSLMTAFIALALVCYQRAEAVWSAVLLALCLATAVSTHYYAVFVLVVFGLAETAFCLEKRRFRPTVWFAICCGLAPIVAFWPLLSAVRAYFHAGFWATPALSTAMETYGWFFRSPGPLGTALAAVAAVGVIITWAQERIGSRSEPDPLSLPLQECVLICGLLLVPLIVLAVTKLIHGGFTYRYMLPSLLGFPLAAGYILARVDRKIVALFVVFVVIAVTLQEGIGWIHRVGSRGRRISPTADVEELVNAAGYPQLPVVISDAHDFVQFSYYAPPELARRLVSVVDPQQATLYAGTDNLDKSLLALRSCLPLQLYEYDPFAAKYSRFLLYSGGGGWDWWPARLVHDRDQISLLAMKGKAKIYVVSLPSRADDHRTSN